MAGFTSVGDDDDDGATTAGDAGRLRGSSGCDCCFGGVLLKEAVAATAEGVAAGEASVAPVVFVGGEVCSADTITDTRLCV